MIKVAELVLVVAALLASAPLAHAADPAESAAAAAFEEGTTAFAAADYVRAAAAFERAYRARPHHDALWNAARAHHRAGEEVAAANLYSLYLREAPGDARDRDTALAALKLLASSLGKLTIHAPADASAVELDGVSQSGAPPHEIWVSAGEHLVVGRFADGAVRKHVHAERGVSTSVMLDHDPGVAPPVSVVPPATNRRRPFPWPVLLVGSAVTLILGGVTTWSALDTVEQRDAFDRDRSPANLEEGRARQTRTNVLLGATAGALAITAVTTLIVAQIPARRDAKAARWTFHAGIGQLGLVGRF